MKRPRSSVVFAEAGENLSMALKALVAHKLRSALTLLGVLVGVFSIILVMTAMRALKSNIEKELTGLGSQTFAIQRWPALFFGGSDAAQKYWRRQNITLAQARQVQRKATLAKSIGLERNFWGGQIETRYHKTPPTVRLFGETPQSFPARNWVIAEGRGLADTDVDNLRDVCVLGDALAKTVFPSSSPVGERLKINGVNYSVVGVLAPKGGELGGDQDNFAVVPITTALNRFGRWDWSLMLLVQARDAASFDDTVEQVRGILRVIRKVRPGDEDDFEIFSNDSVIEQFNAFTLAVRVGAAVVSSIALIAAGIGIMNIMLVSVTERTREIGVRRAVGAKKRNIMTQFVIEAVVLCEVGGVVGVLLGVGGGNLAAHLLKAPPVVPFDWAILGLVICSAVGIVFGSYPAWKAANLDPIESLRYE